MEASRFHAPRGVLVQPAHVDRIYPPLPRYRKRVRRKGHFKVRRRRQGAVFKGPARLQRPQAARVRLPARVRRDGRRQQSQKGAELQKARILAHRRIGARLCRGCGLLYDESRK